MQFWDAEVYNAPEGTEIHGDPRARAPKQAPASRCHFGYGSHPSQSTTRDPMIWGFKLGFPPKSRAEFRVPASGLARFENPKAPSLDELKPQWVRDEAGRSKGQRRQGTGGLALIPSTMGMCENRKTLFSEQPLIFCGCSLCIRSNRNFVQLRNRYPYSHCSLLAS